MAKGTTEKIRKKALGLMYALLIAGFGAAAISLVHWQLVEGEQLKSAAMEQSLRSTGLPAMRGTIYDTTGTKVLAQSASVWTVVLEPHYLSDNDNLRRIVANGLSEILGLDAMDLYERTGEAGSYYDVVERKVETEVRDRIVELMNQNEISNGIRLIPDYKRYYPYGTVASNVLGFTGNDNDGLGGLELYYEEELSGSAGRLVAAKNAFGTDMPFEYEQIVEAQDGYDLVLTIDETVQSVLEKYLQEGIEKFMIKNGAVAVMMDVDTGGILGLATHPNFDPNDPLTIQDQNLLKEIEKLPEGDERKEAVANAQYTQWRNKGVSDLYYPGSVYKMCTGSMGIEEGVITEESLYTCKGYEKIEGMKDSIHCWNHDGHGTTTFREGLCNSCNPWFMHIAGELGADVFCRYREAFGFEDSTGIDLPGEADSLLHAREDMGEVELKIEAFGQNFSITPIQMITASAAVANGGYLVRPHVVDRIVDKEGNIVKSADKSYRRQVISESTSATLCDILRQNVASGPARGGYVSGYRVCGKTGTSEKVDKHNQDLIKDPNARMTYIASYCGFAPAEDPKYALLVFFDEPDDENNGHYTAGNAIAGPIFSAIMQELLPYLGVEVMYSEDEYDEQRDTVSPSVAGKTLEEALEEIEEAGLEYDIVGSEESHKKVTEQIPEGGASVPKDGKVVLYTSGYDVNNTMTQVPDFFQMDLANAVFEAAMNDLQVTINGSRDDDAMVMLQGIEPGEKVKKGTVITLTFGSKVNTDVSVILD